MKKITSAEQISLITNTAVKNATDKAIKNTEQSLDYTNTTLGQQTPPNKIAIPKNSPITPNTCVAFGYKSPVSNCLINNDINSYSNTSNYIDTNSYIDTNNDSDIANIEGSFYSLNIKETPLKEKSINETYFPKTPPKNNISQKSSPASTSPNRYAAFGYKSPISDYLTSAINNIGSENNFNPTNEEAKKTFKRKLKF